MKKVISTILAFSLLLGCNTAPASETGSRTATSGGEGPMDIYSPIPAEDVPVEPLEAVEAAEIVRTTEPRPRELSVGTRLLGPPDASGNPSYELTLDTTHVLFTSDYASFVVTEIVALRDRAERTLIEQRDRDYETLTFLNEQWRIRLNGDRDRFRIIHEVDQAEITRLLGLVERTMERGTSFPWEAVLVGAGGLLIGVIGGFLMGFVAAN